MVLATYVALKTGMLGTSWMTMQPTLPTQQEKKNGVCETYILYIPDLEINW